VSRIAFYDIDQDFSQANDWGGEDLQKLGAVRVL